MFRTHTRTIHGVVVAGVFAVVSLLAFAGLQTADAADAPTTAPAKLTPFKFAMVTSFDDLPYFYARQQGYYKDVGLDVELSRTDGGPTIVTGVINGTYDAANTASFPVLIAIAHGAPLKLLPGVDIVHAGAGNSGLVVKQDSPIKGYKDLVGKTVATNALTSLTVLSTKLGMKRAGVKPDDAHFIALPFKTSLEAVARGQADAAVVISPFYTEAELDGLKVIADPIGEQMPEGSPYSILITSTKTWTSKPKELKAFEAATFRAIKKLEADPALQRKLAVSLVGLSKPVAAKVPLPAYRTGPVNLEAFQKYANDVAEFGYTSKPVEVSKVVERP